MKPYWIGILLIVIGFGACSPSPDPSTNQPPVVAPSRPATSAPAFTPTLRSSQPTLKPSASPTANVLSPIQKTLGGQVVQINAQDLLTVTMPSFTLTGRAPSGTVVSVNDDFVVVDSDQSFSFELALQEGPNLVEIIASNPQGQQVSFEWVVIYEPGQ